MICSGENRNLPYPNLTVRATCDQMLSIGSKRQTENATLMGVECQHCLPTKDIKKRQLTFWPRPDKPLQSTCRNDGQ